MQSTSMGRLSMPMLSEYQETILRHLLELRKVSSQPVLSGKHLQNALSQRGDFHTKEFVDAMRFLSDNDYINAFRDIGTGNILEINIRPKGLEYFGSKQRFMEIAEKAKQEVEAVEREKDMRWERAYKFAVYALMLSGLAIIVSILSLITR